MSIYDEEYERCLENALEEKGITPGSVAAYYFTEGFKQGWKEGFEIGRKEALTEVIGKKLLESGRDLHFVAETTERSFLEVLVWAQELGMYS